ncbi:hypothetical protein [Geodermatophilus sp. SYSU D00815]
MTVRSAFWRLRFARWGRRPAQRPGYTLLLPVPGDLPVFLDLALAVCRTQAAEHRLATLVIPDVPSEEVRRRVDEAAPTWPGPLHLLPLPAVDRAVLPRLGDPGRNHGAQLIRGVHAATSTHVVLHDADLFLMDPRVHEDEYALARARDLDVLGVSPPWDPWYAARGRTLAATWEQVARVDWLRAFPPHRHLGHDAVVGGERHTFDTTFWPQLHSDPARIAVGDGFEARIVHLNYVISTYRAYQRRSGPFHDDSFRLLLIRLFVDLFAREGDDYGLPDVEALAAGLGRAGDPERAVGYAAEDGENYRRMRDKLQAVVRGPWSDPDRAARCLELLRRFDDFYGLTPAA